MTKPPRLRHGPSGRAFALADAARLLAAHARASTAPTSSPTCAPEKFETFFRSLKRNGFVGGNITKPHKEAAFRLVDRREPAADAIGAVNTVWYEDDALIGGNTDWLGIVLSLDDDPSRLGRVARQGRRARRRRLGARRRSTDFSSAASPSRSSTARSRAPSSSPPNSARAHRRTATTRCRSLLAEADVLINNTSLGMAGNPPLDIDLDAAEAFGDRL